MVTKNEAYDLATKMERLALDKADKLDMGAMGQVEFDKDATGNHIVLRVRFDYQESD